MHRAFSEYRHYGVPYCLQTTFYFKIQVKNLLADVPFKVHILSYHTYIKLKMYWPMYHLKYIY